MDFAGLGADATICPIVTSLHTAVAAVRKVSTADLATTAMAFFNNCAISPLFAGEAGILADVATSQSVAALCPTQEVIVGNVYTAPQDHSVTAAWHLTLNGLLAFDLVLLMVQPAWKRFLHMAARKLNTYVLDDLHTLRGAHFTTDFRASVFT